MLLSERPATAPGAATATAVRPGAGRWFQGAAAPRPGAALRVVCFPHAGGTPSVFHDWAAHLGERVQVVPVLLPGRGLRMREEPYTAVAPLADAAARALLECELADDYVLFGHSMGALLAYETACRLRVLGARGPRHLVVSGSRAPHHYGVPLRRSTDDEGLRALVSDLGGLGPDEAMGRAYLERRLPVLRADLAACEGYRWQPRAPLDCPMTAYSAQGDQIATAQQVDGWREYTRGSLLRRHLPGGHFYLNGPPRARLLRELRAETDRLLGAAGPARRAPAPATAAGRPAAVPAAAAVRPAAAPPAPPTTSPRT